MLPVVLMTAGSNDIELDGEKEKLNKIFYNEEFDPGSG